MASVENNKIETLPKFIQKSINARIEKYADEMIVEIKEKIDLRRDEIIAGVVLNIKDYLEIDDVLARKLTIVIKKDV